MRTYSLLLVLAFLASCGLPDAGETPTWAEDAKPILMANCARCHSYPAIGGAPDSFRLDTYDDFVTEDGRVIYGAASMAWHVALRTDTVATEEKGVESMPPEDATNQGLTDRQIDILQRWYLTSDPRPARGVPPAGNSAPTMTLRSPLQVTSSALTVEYEIRDADSDFVTGEVRAGPSFESGVRMGTIHSGRGTVQGTLRTLPNGSYRLFARLDDGGAFHDIDLGMIDVAGEKLPTVAVTRPRAYDIIADIDSPFDVEIEINDLDVTDGLQVTIEAVRLDERVTVVSNAPATVGLNQFSWDTTALTEGPGWRLDVVVRDGAGAGTHTSLPFRISHATTDLGYGDVAFALGSRCGVCHSGDGLGPFALGFGVYDPSNGDVWTEDDTYVLRGKIFRRVFEQRNMPPPSHIVASEERGNAVLSEEDRALVREWLLGGAPE